MAVDMFIKIDDLKGEAKDADHKDEIDVLSWGWGMNQSGTGTSAGAAGAGKVDVQDMSFTKYVDKAVGESNAVLLQRRSTSARPS